MNILSNDIMHSFNSSVYYPYCQFLKTRFTNSFNCDKNISGCSIWSRLEEENLDQNHKSFQQSKLFPT